MDDKKVRKVGPLTEGKEKTNIKKNIPLNKTAPPPSPPNVKINSTYGFNQQILRYSDGLWYNSAGHVVSETITYVTDLIPDPAP